MQILQGIRIIDWTAHVQGPTATAMLADLGAEVIKIEAPGQGEAARKGGGNIPGAHVALQSGDSYAFEASNRNKKSVAVDLKKPKGREIVYRLVEKSDVFVENNRKGVPERLGLSYQTLCRFNPKIIYVSGSGYGAEGPDSERPCLDQMVLARSGMMEIIAPPNMPPQYFIGGIADRMGGVMLSYAVVAALLARERLGVGQWVGSSLLGSFMLLQRGNLEACLNLGRDMPRYSRERAANPLNNYYQCADGRWIFMGLSDSDRFWPDFCKALGQEQLKSDPRFQSPTKRRENKLELILILNRVFATRSSLEWAAIFDGYRDFPFDVVKKTSEFAQDPQVLANGYIEEVRDPSSNSTFKHVGVPITFSKTPAKIRTIAPRLGEHTEQILSEVCGFTADDISSFRKEEVI